MEEVKEEVWEVVVAHSRLWLVLDYLAALFTMPLMAKIAMLWSSKAEV